jgi:hypothetical protein
MKKLTYLASAILAAVGFSSAANADIAISGSADVAYVDAGGNATSMNGGGISFALSTTTDAGVSIAASGGISNDNDSSGDDSAATGLTKLTFGFSNGSLSVGDDIGIPDGTGKVGELVTWADTNQTTLTYEGSIGDDEGSGASFSTAMGDMTIALSYYWDGASAGDVDGATATGSGISVSVPLGGASLTAATAQAESGSTTMNDSGVAISYAVGGGTLGLGYNVVAGDTAADEAESIGLSYSTTVGSASVAIGYQTHDGSSNTGQTTDVTVSQSLGGGASIWAEIRSVSGTRSAETASTSDTVFAVGSSVSF